MSSCCHLHHKHCVSAHSAVRVKIHDPRARLQRGNLPHGVGGLRALAHSQPAVRRHARNRHAVSVGVGRCRPVVPRNGIASGYPAAGTVTVSTFVRMAASILSISFFG